MNNKAIATILCLRRLSGGQPPFSFLSRCRAGLFAVLALAPLLAVLISTSASAQTVKVAGQLLIDLSATRGTNTATGMSSVGGETNLIYWTNYGTLGGTFNMIEDSVYSVGYTGGTNPPAMTLLTSGSVSALAPESPTGVRMMVASFTTPSQLQGSSHYTVECWFYNLTTANPRGVFAWTDLAPAAGTDGGEFSAAATASEHFDANNLNWNSAGTPPSTSVWHHGVITYDGFKERVYLDGTLVNSAVHTLNIDAESIYPALFSQLGANPPTATSSSFNGAIAALRVHTEALAASDVANNYAAGIAAVSAAPTNSISTDSSPATAVLGVTATLNGVLNATTSPGTTALTFFYDTQDDGDVTNAWPHSATATTPGTIPGTFSANLTGLTIGTTYYVRIYAADANATNMSSFVTTFTTQGKPVVSNGGAFFVAPGADTLSANLINDGTAGAGAIVTIYWGPTDGGTTPASWANSIVLGTVNNGVQGGLASSLTTLGKYYFTVSAQNTYGTTFVTPSSTFQEGLIFGLNTANLPAASLPPAPLTPVTTWQSSAGAFTQFSGGPDVHDFGGAPFLSLIGANSDSMTLPVSSFPVGGPQNLTINGATMVAVLEPTLPTFGYPGNVGGITIASVYDTQFGLGAGGALTATIAGGSVTGVTVTSGGSGYTSPPTVTFAAPGGMSANTTATGTAQISSAGQVTNVIVTSGGSGYAWQRTAQVLNVPVPTVTFSGGGGSGAAGTAVMSTAAGCQIEGIVNQNRPTDTADTPTDNAGGNGWNWANAGYGIPTSDDVYIPVNQISVVSIVAGSGLNGVGQPTPGGPQDNNYMVYVNGVLVEDTAAGFVSSLTLTANNGAGYLPHGGTVPLSFNTPPGGTPATGYMQVSSSTTIPGHIRGVVLTSGGSGYTAADPPVITIPAPTDTTVSNDTAVVTFTDQSLGNYLPSTSGGVPSLAGAASAGWNGGGMSVLDYNLAHGTYGSGNANSTFGIGDQAGTGEIGLTGYLGDVTVYGEALTPAQRQALENAEGAKYITGATESFTITTSIGNGIITGPATVVQGYSATYNFIPTVAYAISGVTVDGVSVGAVTSYTFTDVSANHSIVVTTVAVPPQNITVTYGAGGTITTNGTVMPSGANWANITGGSYPAFTLAVSNGFALGVIKADGVTIPNATIIGAGGTYTFANIGGNGSGPSHTLTATFVALPTTPVSSAVPESEFLFFSVDTASLPQLPTFTGPTPITNWPMFYSSQGVTSMIQGASGGTPALANTFTDANGVVWENNIEGEGPTSTGYQFYPGGVGAATGTTIPNNGATIVTVVSPIENGLGAGDPWHSIVDVFFGCVELSVNPGTGLIQAIVDNDKGGYDGTASAVATSTYAIPSGSNTVLSLVVQPNGSFAVYANTVLVITNAGLGPLYMTAGEQGFTFANNIQIGSDGPDTWSCFNGLIGNTYFWTTALTTTERTNLEAALMTEFHAVVPPNFNWVGPNNGNWSDAANWSNTVPFAVNTVPGSGGGQTPVFSLAGAGLTVNLDVAESVAGLTFNSNAVIAAPTGNTLTLDDGAANPTITVGTNASATIGANLSLTEGLNVYGPGLLTLASNVTLGATTTGYVEVAQNGSSTATIVQTGGTLTTFSVAQSWATGNGPGVMLGGADNSATSATYTLSGGTLLTPNIGCVTENFGVNPAVLVPPSTDGAAAILNLNGGVLEASDNDSVDPNALAEGSAHLIFNTTHTYVQAGGAIISTGYSNSISVPLEHFPAGPAIDGGLTKMGAGILDLLAGSTYTGPTVVSNGILACATATSLGGNSVTIVPGAQLELEFTGTTTVYQLFTNGNLTSVPPGVYGSTASGAAHADDTDFAVGSPGKLTVLGAVTLGEKPLFTSSGFTGTAGNGSLLLQGTGGISGGTYLVLGSTNVAAPLADWVVLGQGTFTGAGFSVSVPVSATVPQEFIRIVVP